MAYRILLSYAALVLLSLTSAAFAQTQPIQFVDNSEQAGLSDFAVNSTGPAFADYDNDGDLDIYIPAEALAAGINNRLWENDGTGRFTNVAEQRGVANHGSFSRGASWGDFDGDGDQDLAVSNMPPGQDRSNHVPTTVYRNLLVETGVANFENVTRAARIMRKGNAEDQRIGGIGNTGAGLAWGDYDNDGDLDLFWKCADYDVENALFENLGDGTFQDVTEKSGVAIQGKVLEANSQGSPNWTDINNDGWIDLLITNEGDANVLLLNNKDGTFSDITTNRRGPNGFAFLNPGNANGACIGDIDNDSDLDFYLPTADQANRLIVSQLSDTGEVNFKDITLSSGTGDVGGARGCTMADFNNDGWIDIYVNNGGLSNVLINDVISQMPSFVQFYIAWEPAENKLYMNNGDLTFTDVTVGSGAEGYGIGSGVGAADINMDGFPDLVVTNRTYYSDGKRVNIPQQNHLLINQGNDNAWLKLRLIGTKSNTNGYGAKVRVTTAPLTQMREKTSAHGYNSSNDPVLIFGLGRSEIVQHIEIDWPSGIKQVLKNVKARQIIEILEPEA
ncbi:MAG: CRTAC1 family protein [Rhodospirillaceae bacterium]